VSITETLIDNVYDGLDVDNVPDLARGLLNDWAEENQ
jgi:hypothetical protein